MASDASKVVVRDGESPGSMSAYHHDFPEIRATGETPSVAASQLINKLQAAADTALSEWRQQQVADAISDVNAFLQSQPN